ncbi:MAG: hypothetical protein ACFFG0_06635 [Candidatus Thorarchaeota archaeon]
MIDKLNHSQELSKWNYRGSDDPGIALIESASIICDILTFYQNLYANEAFLRTAQWGESIKKLVRLTGYQLSPGIGGDGLFAFEVKGNRAVIIPAKFPLKAQLEGIEETINFETLKESITHPEFSNLKLFKPITIPRLLDDPKNFYIKEPSEAKLKTGDRLLVYSSQNGEDIRKKSLFDAAIIIIKDTQELYGRSAFSIEGSLKKFFFDSKQLFAYKLGVTYRTFGHNASSTLIRYTKDEKEEITILNEEDFIRPHKYNETINPSINEFEFPLDGDIDNLVSGMDIIIQYGSESNLFSTIKEISDIKKLNYLFGMFSGSSTVLDIDPSVLLGSYYTRLSRQSVQVIQGIGDIRRHLLGSEGIITVNDLALSNVWKLSNKIDIPLHILLEFQKEAKIIKDLMFEAAIVNSLKKRRMTLQNVIELSLEDFMSITLLDEQTSQNFLSKIRILAIVMDAEQCRELSIDVLDVLPLDEESEITNTDIRFMQFHEIKGDLLKIHPYEVIQNNPDFSRFLFFGSESALKQIKDKQLVFNHPDQENIFANVISSINNTHLFPDSPCCLITINKKIETDSIDSHNNPIKFRGLNYNVYGNLIYANQGKTERDIIIGSGDNREKFQAFKLPKFPLTYLLHYDETPSEVPEIDVYVNDILWKRVPSFYNRLPNEEIYKILLDENNESWVQFGDGKTGSKLPSGVDNIKATYRIEVGAYGEIKKGTTISTGMKLSHLDKVHLVTPVSGGSKPETGYHAALTAPYKFQSLDRLVSIKDYETETLSIPGVLKSKAFWKIGEDNIPTINVTVLLEGGRSNEFDKIKEKMMNLDKYYGPQRYFINIIQARFKYVYIDLSFKRDPKFKEENVKKSIQNVLGVVNSEENDKNISGGLFSLYNREFGQPEYWTRIEGIIQNVPGVTWLKINKLGFFNPEIQDPTKISTSDLITDAPQKMIDCTSNQILRLYFKHLELSCLEVAQ